MQRDVVIARAFGGEPLKRVAVGETRGSIYIANPLAIKAVEEGRSNAIGFPAEDVYVFDESIFCALEMEWRESNRTSVALWAKLRQYGPA
jgi:hypothetical protein